MIDDGNAAPSVDMEIVLSAVLKLTGVYLLYSAILQSGNLMSTLFTISMQLSYSTAISPQEWGGYASNIIATALAAGLAIILIRHGSRGAHWLVIKSDLKVSVLTPTRKWFRAALALVGMWILATQFLGTISTAIWSILAAMDSSSASVFPYGPVFGIVSLLHAAALLVLGLTLIFAANRLGDFLYRISGAAKADNTTAQAQ